MPLAKGTRLGPYEVIAAIGAGGMGEVYKAKDTRLDRTVAIKVLPSHLADNPDLKQRFEREAKAVSSLNHPHICTLYDIGEQDGTDFLVMEYIEGETLADRLKKGALPLDQALRYAIEIADALDKAHRQGVVHRDLKPGNVMVTKSGAKLLDFGLAKLKASEPGQQALSALPTEEKPLTDKGSIIGTFQYMAPEQWERKDADARTDIFAFGAVLYEMVTGRRAFEGKSQASLIAAILERDPAPVSELQSLAPPALDRVVGKCLSKDPDDRWQTARDLHDELKWVAEGGEPSGVASRVVSRKNPGRLAVFMLMLGTIVGALVASLVVWNLKPLPVPPSLTRFALVLPVNDQLTATRRHLVALSPDGKRLVYCANERLYLREMDEMEATAIRGTEGGGENPFFSSDGQWVGFWVNGKLKKVPVSGGAPVTLCETLCPIGASWGPDDTIVFTQLSGGILQVSAHGGAPEVLIPMDSEKGEVGQSPLILPGGESVLFTLRTGSGGSSGSGSWDEAQIVVQSLETGERRVLVEGGADARYVPTGHLVYALGGTLMAAPFDLERLEVTGDPVPIVEGVMRTTMVTGVAHFSFSENGALVFVGVNKRNLEWVGRKGAVEALQAPPRAYLWPRLSPDGERVAVGIEGDVWIYDIPRGTSSRLTFTGDNSFIAWAPDGDRVAFSSGRAGPDNVFWKQADGSGEAEQLTTGKNGQHVESISSDGQVLAWHEHHPTSASDIWVMSLDGERQPRPFRQTQFGESSPAFSHDGRWLAYSSGESGRGEVYVQPFPGPGGKIPISTEGGTDPVWARSGRELFYRNGDKMMAVDITTERGFTAGNPRLIFERPPMLGRPPGTQYDVTADGQQFLMTRAGEQGVTLNVVLNWFEELKRLVPTN